MRIQHDSYDVVVVGGGPAGSTTATLVAQRGHRVLLLERETFPRFHVGESLIPATYDVLERLGMLETMRESAFTKKYSVQFITGDGRESAPFYFHETDPSDRSQTWQVERAQMDHMLFENARAHGVEAHDGDLTVNHILFEKGRAVGVRVRFRDGSEVDVGAKVVVDATGQRALLSRRLNLREQDPFLRMASIFTHFEGARRDDGIDEGATLIIHNETRDGWFWYIPLHDDRVSVGVVGQIDYLIKGRKRDPQNTFDEEIARCPGIAPRLEGARQSMEVKVLNDFSYRTRQGAGDGWVMVGDAYGFLDPMYSTGVLLAFKSGELAADAINDALDVGDTSRAQLSAFEPSMRAGLDAFRKLVYAFYDKNFSFAGFLKNHPQHRLAIVDILVGDVFERDFDPLFDDMSKRIRLPGYPPPVAAETLATA